MFHGKQKKAIFAIQALLSSTKAGVYGTSLDPNTTEPQGYDNFKPIDMYARFRDTLIEHGAIIPVLAEADDTLALSTSLLPAEDAELKFLIQMAITHDVYNRPLERRQVLDQMYKLIFDRIEGRNPSNV
jgi:hypothetical protein